jgi:lipopolysaccharide/colanic/teichoic acid biosynthesis glycosyltransferase
VARYGFYWHVQDGVSFLTFVPPFLIALALWILIFSSMQLDGFRRGWDLSAILSQLFLAVCLLMMVLMAGGYLLRVFISRLTLAYFSLLLFSGFLFIRCLAHTALSSKYFAKGLRRVLIVGNGPVAREMAEKIEQHPELLSTVVGFLYFADTPLDRRIATVPQGTTTVRTLGVVDLIRAKQIDDVIITFSDAGNPELTNLASQCRREGIGVSVVPHPYELYLSRPQLFEIGGLPVLQLSETRTKATSVLLKRGLDVILGSLLLMVSAPVVAIGALAFVGKKGGPFTRELRCGQFGKHFWMYRLNSDRDSAVLSRYERILQQLSITEIPQLWNVFRGDMSLVGPRPESPERAKHYSEWQRQRLKVVPGITGLAQVRGLRQQHSSEEKTRFDLQYLMHASLFLDISLVLQTLWTLIGRLFHPHRLLSDGVPALNQNTADRLLERTLQSVNSAQSSAD